MCIILQNVDLGLLDNDGYISLVFLVICYITIVNKVPAIFMHTMNAHLCHFTWPSTQLSNNARPMLLTEQYHRNSSVLWLVIIILFQTHTGFFAMIGKIVLVQYRKWMGVLLPNCSIASEILFTALLRAKLYQYLTKVMGFWWQAWLCVVTLSYTKQCLL